MADRIMASIASVRPVISGVQVQDDLHSLVSRFVGASLYKSDRTVGRIRKDIVHLMARRHFPIANNAGADAARPILDALGGRELTQKGMTLRGEVLGGFRKYTKANMQAFRAALKKEVGTLSGEIEASFARAYRDGVSKKQLIADLVTADRGELKRIREVRTEIRQAAGKVKAAETRLASSSKRKLAQNKRELKAAAKAHVKAKAKIGTAKTFYARFETSVQGHARDAIRRQVERSQFSRYRQAGYATFAWCAVNGSDACPQCSERHGQSGDRKYWRNRGMPGDGSTYCGSACMCRLIPAEYKEGNESLDRPLRA